MPLHLEIGPGPGMVDQRTVIQGFKSISNQYDVGLKEHLSGKQPEIHSMLLYPSFLIRSNIPSLYCSFFPNEYVLFYSTLIPTCLPPIYFPKSFPNYMIHLAYLATGNMVCSLGS